MIRFLSRAWYGTVAFAAFAAFTSTSFAWPLPKGSVQLTKAEVAKIYSGMTADWDTIRGYHAPDGKYYSHAKDKSWFFEGKWTVRGNTQCISGSWTEVKTGKTGKSGKRDCNTWMRGPDGKMWDLWSQAKDQRNDWSDENLSKLSKGDRGVVKTITELKAKVRG
ncbi:DUF995 domain-containing protein [Mesorhizobium sp. B2-4-6]|uniref:DUF995 domain-containing protein n=1 Tax=Mesorhizobium sp. B2-4-6 TaxID=2589943 RepID=UPI00112E158C|nr:DUF995 domain-containing protein [Mesorhizobium sp. B2-4-6]TPL46404.1 hypothetical protein FJ957_16735 [Mesorhizobium sp. B2-4-6]